MCVIKAQKTPGVKWKVHLKKERLHSQRQRRCLWLFSPHDMWLFLWCLNTVTHFMSSQLLQGAAVDSWNFCARCQRSLAFTSHGSSSDSDSAAETTVFALPGQRIHPSKRWGSQKTWRSHSDPIHAAPERNSRFEIICSFLIFILHPHSEKSDRDIFPVTPCAQCWRF